MTMTVGVMLAFDSFRWSVAEEGILAFADGTRDSPCATLTQVSFAETAVAFRPLRDPVAKADDYSTHLGFRWTMLFSTMSPLRRGPRIVPQRRGALGFPSP
jgi:hypothetical protein